MKPPIYTPDHAAVRLFNILGGDMAHKVMREMVASTPHQDERVYWNQVGNSLSVIRNHESIHKALGIERDFVCNDWTLEK